MKDFLRLGLIMIPICAVLWLVAPEGQAPGIIVGLILLVSLSAAPANPTVRLYVLAHARETQIAGGVTVCLGVGLFMAQIFWPGAAPDERLTMALALCAVVAGLALLMMPASARQISAVAEQRKRGGDAPLDPAESGPAEAVRALRFVRDNPVALAQVMLPWTLVGLGLLLASLYLGGDLIDRHQGRAAGAAVLTMLGVSIVVTMVSYPLSALAWARFSAGHPASPFAPLGASWDFLWRFLILSAASYSFGKQLIPLGPYLAELLGLTDAKVLDSLVSLGSYLLILMVFGPMALVLPAIAVGGPRQTSALVGTFFQPGRRYALGLVLAAAPFLAVNLVIEVTTAFLPQPKELSPWILLGFVPMAVTFLGIATVMTYLVQVYRKAAAQTDVGPYEPFVADAPE